jgi:hypothetical protein
MPNTDTVTVIPDAVAIIPVAFEVRLKGHDTLPCDARAARELVPLLMAQMPGGIRVFTGAGEMAATIDSWWLPNHPDVDGHDADDPTLHWSNECPAPPAPTGRWAVVEIMGHRRLGGSVTETTIAGKPMLQVDIPGVTEDAGGIQLYGADSIFSIAFCDEATARAAAKRTPPLLSSWETRELGRGDDDDDVVDADEWDGGPF